MASKQKDEKRAPRKSKIKAANSAKTRGKPRGKPFTPDNPHKFKRADENEGTPDPRINRTGRPKLLGESYKAWLAQTNDQGLTNAEAIADAMGKQAMLGKVDAAREIRAATEGDKVLLATWQLESIAALKAGTLTAQEIIDAVGFDEARAVIIAAGLAVPQGTP